jgi:transcription initiation factor TFIIH subunit 4
MSGICFEFANKDLFEATEAEALRYDGVLLSIPAQKILFIDPSIKDAIKDYVMGQQKELRAAM